MRGKWTSQFWEGSKMGTLQNKSIRNVTEQYWFERDGSVSRCDKAQTRYPTKGYPWHQFPLTGRFFLLLIFTIQCLQSKARKHKQTHWTNKTKLIRICRVTSLVSPSLLLSPPWTESEPGTCEVDGDCPISVSCDNCHQDPPSQVGPGQGYQTNPRIFS